MFPTIRELTRDLIGIKRWLQANGIDETDIRLQVVDGGWSTHTGDSSYDQDHRGFWGASFIDRTTNCRDLARDLIDQAREHEAQCGGVE